MQLFSNNILQTLTGKSSLKEVSEDDIKQVAERYPYFAAPQFLLAKKLYEDNNEENKAAIQKAVLHFTDVLWFHYNFFEDELANGTAQTTENILNIESAASTTNTNAENIIVADELPQVNSVMGDVEILNEPITEINSEPDDVQSAKESEESNERLSNLLKEQAAAFEKPVEDIEVTLETTPQHRIDYFASQGIKLDPEKETNDKLGSQLKRFTEWLKQMKRINPNLNNLETDAAAETQVQTMAEHSNQPEEIVTEAMAEVLVKQGKPEQAIHIYEKLSFNNHSKSAYFAAKIQELKV